MSFSSFGLSLKSKDIQIPKTPYQSTSEILATFNKLEKEHQDSTPTLWRIKFEKTLLLKKKSNEIYCKNIKELAETKAFPLHQLALINSYEICPSPKPLVFNPLLFPKWLQIQAAQTLHTRSKKIPNPELSFQTAKYLGQHIQYKDQRISYLKSALSLAKKKDNKEEIKKLNQLIYKEAPHLNPTPNNTPKDHLIIADSYRRNRGFTKATLFYKKVLNNPQSHFKEVNSSFRWLVWIYKNQKKYKKEIIASKQWSQWLLKQDNKASSESYYNNQINLAKNYWNYNKNKDAIQLLNEIIKAPQSDKISAQIYWIRGLVNEQEGHLKKTLKDWNKTIEILKRTKKNSAFLDKVLWKKAWLLRKQKKYKKSLQVLHEINRSTKNPYVKYKVLFWIGETYKNLNFLFLSNKYFNDLIKKDTLGYYGLMAYYNTNKHLNIPVSKTNLQDNNIRSQDYNSENIVYWLLLFNQSELLSRFLNFEKINLLAKQNKTSKDWLSLIHLYSMTKRYLDIFISLDDMKPKVKKHFLKKHVDLLFPFEYKEHVEKFAKKRQLSPSFVYALIRQESAFNNRARSKADAFGLMQMIPSTARQTSKKLGLTYRGFRQLYSPSRNILLGTFHLKYLIKKYKNSFILSTAAYNAGSTPVNKWRKDYKNSLSPFEFIENIPYEETKTYVRLLIRNYVFYHNLLEEKNDKYPDWIFNLDSHPIKNIK